MYPDLPIEQLLRCRDMRFQFRFATEAKELVADGDDFLLSASHKGLHVLAKNEDGLTTPVDTLRDVYGERLEIQPPRVRLIEGVQVLQPIMHVRISLEVKYFDAVKHAMQARGATPEEEYVRSMYGVLRYEAALADLLGLPAELAKLTEGSAQQWIVLSRYALITRDPGGKAA